LSLIAISVISFVYDDLYTVLKVSNKDSLLGLLLLKWFLISLIIGFNIYRLKQVKLDENEKKEIFNEKQTSQKIYPKKSQSVLNKKEKLNTTTDVILKRYLGVYTFIPLVIYHQKKLSLLLVKSLLIL